MGAGRQVQDVTGAPKPTDGDLLGSSRHDPESFGRFYDRHVAAVLGFCMRRTGCAETAADLTAEVFATAYAKRTTYRDAEAGARPWLYGIARNQVRSWLRRSRVSDRHRRRFGWEPVIISDEEAERVAELADLPALREDLRAAMASLPAGAVRAVELRVVDELPYAEVAARLGCSEGAARVRVSRGLTALAERLETP